MPDPKYHVVLVRPEIPGNSGQVGRSCMALGCRLHLVHPLGYEISDKQLKRAGMDYWPLLDLVEHADVKAFLKACQDQPVVLMSTRGREEFSAAKVPEGAWLVYGNEGSGLPEEIWEKYGDQSLRIPMDPRARSLNLSASVAMTLGALVLK